MKHTDWNQYCTIEEALAVSPRACKVDDGEITSIAPCGTTATPAGIVREYLREYDMGDYEADCTLWSEGSVEIYSRRDPTEPILCSDFYFRADKSFQLERPWPGETRIDGYTY